MVLFSIFSFVVAEKACVCCVYTKLGARQSGWDRGIRDTLDYQDGGDTFRDGSALETQKAPLPRPRHDEMRTTGCFNFTTVTTFPCVESMTMQ